MQRAFPILPTAQQPNAPSAWRYNVGPGIGQKTQRSFVYFSTSYNPQVSQCASVSSVAMLYVETPSYPHTRLSPCSLLRFRVYHDPGNAQGSKFKIFPLRFLLPSTMSRMIESTPRWTAPAKLSLKEYVYHALQSILRVSPKARYSISMLRLYQVAPAAIFAISFEPYMPTIPCAYSNIP
jgi:hypothetical protein